MCRRILGGRFMNRFAEFSAEERCILLCALGSLSEKYQNLLEKNPQSQDAKFWVWQAHKAALLKDEMALECYKKIRSA